MPALADRWRTVAPDFPGFGHGGRPADAELSYSFDGDWALETRSTDTVPLVRNFLSRVHAKR
jgi:pimeloyl-ACP methyl ester carboxylesterase